MSKKSAILIVLLLPFAANAQFSKIKGNGNIETKKVSTASYDKVDVSVFFDVLLVAGKEGSLSVTGESNLLNYVVTEVKDNTLKIFCDKSTRISPSTGKTITIEIPFESLEEVTLAGSGEVKSQSTIKSASFTAKLVGSGDINLSIESDNLEASVVGSGDMELQGTAGTFKSKVTGSGDMKAYELKAKNAEAEVSGSGDSKIYCTESLFARISGSGDINYKGDPQKKDTKVSGSGEITKA